jgi:hypothetical protein
MTLLTAQRILRLVKAVGDGACHVWWAPSLACLHRSETFESTNVVTNHYGNKALTRSSCCT